MGLGEHLFEYQLDRGFFEKFENEEVQRGKLMVNLLLDKNERFLSLELDIKGHIFVPCDRCLEDTKLEVSIAETLFVKFGEEGQEVQDENVIFIPEEEYQLDIGNILNDYITLAKPIKVVHSGIGKDVCKLEMLEKIEEYREKSSAKETWSGLEELRDKLSNK